MKFKIEHRLEGKLGRAGEIETPNGIIQTPAFVTVGTKATVKSLTLEMVSNLGAQVILANTYHLYLEPNDQLIKEAGGLAKFMNWQKPTMTDSGGFQVFSLGVAFGKNISKLAENNMAEILLEEITEANKKNRGQVSANFKPAKIDENGVMFRSHIDGSAHYFTPEKSIEIQHNIGANIIFAFDECTSPNESVFYQRESLDRTHRWAKKSLVYHLENGDKSKYFEKTGERQALFGIVQGGRHEELRKKSAEILANMTIENSSGQKIGFDGFGIGGSFEKTDMQSAVKWVNEILPEEKPRHLLGIGEPEDLFMAVENGCDLFDCVAPTRIARTGQVYTNHGKINLRNAEFKNDFNKVEENCGCYTCQNYTRAYLSHLFRSDEMLGATLASAHNLFFIINLVKDMRKAILEERFETFKKEFLEQYLKL